MCIYLNKYIIYSCLYLYKNIRGLSDNDVQSFSEVYICIKPSFDMQSTLINRQKKSWNKQI